MASEQPTGDADGDGLPDDVMNIQSHYLRSPSPSFSTVSESRFSMISGSEAESIFMEPIHLSSAIAAKQIINEELPRRPVRAESIPESMLESAEQLMVEDLYNRVRDLTDDRSPYNTPCVLDLQRAMVQDRLEAPASAVDQVWPNVFIAEKSVALNKARLKRMGITHILNAAHATGVYTGATFYAGMGIGYMGVEVDDFPHADISPHFRSTAEFLDEALLTHKGTVLVVSVMGVSRSAVLVASYLMIFQHMSIMEALTAMRKTRAINPNEGFLKQLRELNEALMEERDDDDDTLSQCSVVDAHARAAIFGDGTVPEDDDEGTDEEEEQSMMGVKARSILMEEEEDVASVVSSVASSASAAVLAEEGLPVPPGQDGGEGEDEDGVGSMVREWQQRNERYRSDAWWEEQLNFDQDDDSVGGAPPAADLESVALSEDVRALKERLARRPRRPPSGAGSASSCSSYSDLWKQRLREIEEQAAARYRRKEQDEGSEGTAAGEEGTAAGEEGGGGGERRKKNIDDDVQSLLSDASSMYSFCQRNKEKLTPLERWRVKRIQFGWNKKEGEEGGGSSASGSAGPRDAEPRTPALEDVDLTAYQTWKLRQQRRCGEEDKDEVVELSRGEDAAAAKRRQRREEILQRSRKNLEESQSMCGGWGAGSSVPLSAFWTGAGPPGAAGDDSVSVLSGRSSAFSSVSQPRGSGGLAPPSYAGPPAPPLLPVPAVPGPGGEPMVDLASIQNWIANVVSETLLQKQSEMGLPPSQAGSLLGFGAGGAPSVLSGAGPGARSGDDRASLLSGASYGRPAAARSGLWSGGLSGASGRPAGLDSGSVSGAGSSFSLASRRSKITTTSVPLYSLFRDEVDLKKLDSMDQEMKSEMRGKMATYEKKKILEDNKRSTLFKKKKPKDEEDEEEEERRRSKEEEFLAEQKKAEKMPARSYGLSGCLNLNPALERERNTSVDDWLRSVRPPPSARGSGDSGDEADPYDDLDASASEFGFPGAAPGEEEEEEFTTRYRPRPGGEGSLGVPANGFGGRYSDPAPAGGRRREAREGAEEEDDVAVFMARTRERARARAAAEVMDDEVLEAWRAQQENK